MLPGLVCVHVARQGKPALLAEHQEPQDEADSGLLVACGAGGHQVADWLVDDQQALRQLQDVVGASSAERRLAELALKGERARTS